MTVTSVLAEELVPFGTFRLNARPVTPADLDFYAALYGRPEVVEHRPHSIPVDRRGAEALLDRDLKHWRQHGFGRWILSHAGEEIGLGGWSIKPNFTGLSIGYHLVPEMWGQGLASEFVRAAVDHARDCLDAETVYGLVRPSNRASLRVLEKAGFRDAAEHRIGGAPMRELRLSL